MKPIDFGGEAMFVIVTYDVHKRRCNKVMKFLRMWLEHRQRSVFSGHLSESQLRIMEYGLKKITDPEYDSIIVFEMARPDLVKERCSASAKETRLTSTVVLTGEQRRKLARTKANIKGRQGSGKIPDNGNRNPGQWVLRF